MYSSFPKLILSFFRVLFALLLLFSGVELIGQPLSGTFTVGSGGQYPTTTAAVADVMSKGVNGPVRLLLKTGTFAEQVSIGPVNGTSATNTITLESESGNAADVVFAFSPTSSDNYVFRLSNAGHLIFKNFSIETSGTSYNRAIYATDNLNSITFEGLRITLPATTSFSEDRGAIIVRPSLSTNIRFINNVITGGAYGILHIGNSTSKSPGSVVSGNTVTNVYARPVFLENLQGLIFNANIITHSGSAYSDYYGAAVQSSTGHTEITRNRITGAVGHALRLYYCSGIPSEPSLIANNFFQSNSSYGTLYILYGLTYTNIYHNSINNTSTGTAFEFNQYQSSNNRIVNNIFQAGSGQPVEFQSTSSSAIDECDYNNLFTSGSYIARDGSNYYGTLAAWRSGTGLEAHAVSFDPQFASPTSLYASAPGVASAGKDLLSVIAVDIDGVARTATPSLGATQFSAAALTPLSGTYTIGASPSNYLTITAAIEAMKANGISGSVTFRLKSQTFAERFVLPAITGMSSSNRIIFESQSGNPGDVVLAPPAASGSSDNYIAQLSNAAFVTIRNITFQPATGTGYNRAIYVINRADDLAFQNLHITLPATSSVSEDRGAIIARPSLSSNIRFINNVITGGAYGILHIGNSSAKSPGSVVTGNTLTDVFARPVFLENLQGLIFNDNTVTQSGAAYSDYYGAAVQSSSGYTEVLRNRITGAVGHALRLYYCGGIESQPSIIANNFFHSNSSYGTFFIQYGLNYTNIYHNSVHNTSTGTAFEFNRYQSTGSRIVNNIFRATSGNAVEFQNSAANSIAECDYNNLFTSGSFIARDGSNYFGTLSAWRSATGFEEHAVSFDPQFATSSSLYASAPGVASAGKDLRSVIPTDIDGVARTATPSLGAAQFSAAALTPLSGTYTIGTGLFDFQKVGDAIEAMKINGINGPVIFRLNSQVFAERFVLPFVSGMSSANPIVFESMSGNPGDVVFTPAAAVDAAGNYIAQLSNAAFVTFRNMTFQPATGTGFNRAIHVINRANDLTFEDLRINLPLTSSVSEDRAAIIARPSLSANIRFIGNVITGGAYGILHIGNSSSKSPGSVVTGNTVTDVFARPVILEHLQGLIFNDNTITHSGTAYSDYYGAAVQSSSGYTEIMRNRITGAAGHALRLYYCSGVSDQPSIIANNFFHSNSSYGTFFIQYGLNHTNIYHNSVHNTSTGTAFEFNRYQSTESRIVNNIFRAGSGYAVEFQNSGATSISECDYNNLFTSGSFITRDGSTNYGTLPAWRAATGFEEHAVSFDPQFATTTSLYASAPGVASAGKDLRSVVATDIDGVVRTATPSLGASQFSAAALTPLFGIYTIGTGTFDYPSISAAIEAMKVNGINGPVTFRLNSQVFEERFVLPFISGMSSANPVVFESLSGNPEDVVFTPPAANDAASNYIALLSNAAFVTFRNMTYQPATGTSFTRAIHVINRADDVTFENLRIILPATNSLSEERGAIIARPSLSTNIRFINNVISGGAYGILHIGNNSSRSPGSVVTGNTITNVYGRPVFMEYLQGLIFNDNTITYSGSAYSDYYGAAIHSSSGYTEIQRNRITGAVGHALRLYYCSGVADQPSIIANNFFHSNSSYGTFYIQYGLNHTNIYHNSVHNTSTGTAFEFNRYQSTGSRIVNNILRAQGGYAIEFQNSAANTIAECDYNNLYTSGSFIGRDGSTNFGTLTSWQAATGFDAHSLSIDPQFVSNTDLHTSVSALAASGKNVNTEVPDDIDGVARPSAPSLGATQFGSSGTALSGEYTISASDSGAKNYTTFGAALDALKNFGISAPVVFKVSGEFNEQLTFLAVSGSSETNTVTFESASGDPNGALIRFASANASSNFTVRLSNADHHRFRNLTIKAEGAAFSRAVHMINRTVDILFEGNVIESVVTTNTTSDRGGILIASAQSQDVQIKRNTIRNGSFGIEFTGPASRANGTLISDNVINEAFYRGIRLSYQSGLLIERNQVLNNPSSTSFVGIEATTVDGELQIVANKVVGGNGTALSLNSILASVDAPALVANNFLQTNNGTSYHTVDLNHLRNVNFYHNNINATGPGTALYMTSSSGHNVRFVNNIIKATGLVIDIRHPSSLVQIDHNDYFTIGAELGYWGTSVAADLASWQALTMQDANSFSVDPQYQAESDLVSLASSIAGAGLDLTSVVPADINGVARTLPVSIGATQFSPEFSVDAGVSRIISPISSCALANEEQVVIEITNPGAAALSGLKVAYQLNNQAQVEENVPAAVTLPPGGKYVYTFSQKVNMSGKQAFTLRASVILPGDQNTENDQITATVTHHPDMVTTVSEDATICRNESITLTATGGSQYAWNTGATSSSMTVTPVANTTYTVQITNASGCQQTREVEVVVREIPEISFTGEPGYIISHVSPLQGSSEAVFYYRMVYRDANGHLPASGFPRVELDANGNGQSTDPLDAISVMQEVDPSDTDVTDGKVYGAEIANLSANISWRSRIVAANGDGCRQETAFVSHPSVSNDLLDVGIYANDISFSKANPAINESIRIYARVRNASDYLAENFVVSAYIEGVQVFTQTISQLNPQASTTVQWDQSFPAAGFYPVKVVVDETALLNEDNELNNFAIRPVLTGDYELPGGIHTNATAGPLEVQPGQAINITGTAEYYGIDEDVDPSVAGATAIAKITGGSQSQTTTRPDGTYSLSLSAPLTPGTYALNIEVTDYTLTGYQGPIQVTVLPAPPRPDLSTTISLDRNTIITGEQVSGTVILQNNGDATANNFKFRYFSCDVVLGEEQIASLAPGQSRTYTFTTTTTAIGDCFNRNNCLFRSVADVDGEVVEKTKQNNQGSAYLTVLPNKPDLTVLNTTNSVIPGNVNMLSPVTFSVRVDNIGGVNVATPFVVNVYLDDALIRSEEIAFLNTCDGNTFTVTHDFGGNTSDRVLTIRVDEPLIIDEYRETNNEFSRVIKHVPPPPQYPNLNVSNRDLSVTPVLPGSGTLFDINVVYRNNGQQSITSPFDIALTITENGIARIETRTVNETILPGATRTIGLNASLATDGDHSLRVRLDPGNTVTEGSEGDNIAQMPLCVDFGVSPTGSAWGTTYVNTLQHLTAAISNYGLFTANDVSVSFFIDDVKVATTIVEEVEPNTIVGQYGVSIPHVFGSTGSFELKVIVDDNGAYTECREDNNEYKAIIRVVPPTPDLRVFSEYISPSKINPDVDEPISIFLSYDNTGAGESPAFKARILVDDVPLGTDVHVPAVAAGDDGTIEIPTPYSTSTAGIRVIRAILDPESELTETSKLNNHATRTLVVGKAPNLYFTDLRGNVDCPDDGSDILLNATVYNDGDLASTAELFFYYIAGADTIPIDSKPFSLEAKQSAIFQTEWLVVSKEYDLYAEIRNSDPMEYDGSDNNIRTKLCGGPYYNLFVQTQGQGIIQKTPDQNRYEGVQQVTVTAVPATGWTFVGWQGDVTATSNPLTVNLESDQSLIAVFEEPLSAPTVADISRCGSGSLTLTANGATAAQTYRWYTQATGGVAVQDGMTFITPHLVSTTSYFVSIVSFNGESPRSELKAVVMPVPEQPAIAAEGGTNCPDEDHPILLRGPAAAVSYFWSTGETTSDIEVTTAGLYALQVRNEDGCASEAAEIMLTEENCNKIIVYNALSPGNGDDLNNHLIFENINKVSGGLDNHLRIFNRWGDVVFEMRGYDNVNNTFVGLNKSGNRLPPGTYFYILEFTSGLPQMSGYIALKR